MDHFEHPRNVGEIENASGMGTVGNAKCGDIMRIYLDIDDNQIIRDVKFKTFGTRRRSGDQQYGKRACKGKSVQDAMQITNKAVMEALDGLPPVKRTLFFVSRRGNPCGALGLFREAWYQNRRTD